MATTGTMSLTTGTLEWADVRIVNDTSVQRPVPRVPNLRLYRARVTSSKLRVLEARVSGTDMDRECDRMTRGVAVGIAIAVAGLQVVALAAALVLVGPP